MCMIGNHVYGKPYRGFESLPLRHSTSSWQANFDALRYAPFACPEYIEGLMAGPVPHSNLQLPEDVQCVECPVHPELSRREPVEGLFWV